MNERLLKLVLAALSFVLIALVGAGIYLVVTDRGHFTLSPQPSTSPTVSPSPSKSGTSNETVAVMKVPVPADSACKECHKSEQVNVVNVPVMGHQLIGWEKCKACHGKDKLVPTAPGHRGIHQEYCTMCHTPRPADLPAALPRPHHQ